MEKLENINCCQCPSPAMKPCWPPPPQEALQHEQVLLVQSPVGSRLLSSGSWHTQDFVCALQDWSLCFPQCLRSPIIKLLWPSRSDSPGLRSPFVRSPGWEAWRGLQSLHHSGRMSLVLLFSSLWATPQAAMEFDFTAVVPLLPPHCSFFFVFGRLYLFFFVFIFFWWVPASPCPWLFNG